MLSKIIEQLSTDDETPETLTAAQEYLAKVIDASASEQWLIASIAKRYIGRGLSFIELIHYGNQGLQQANKHWEWEKSIKYPALEAWWIRRAISSAFASHLPTLKAMIAAQKHLQVELVRNPTDEEIALEMGLLKLDDTVKVYMVWQGGPDLGATIEQDLKDAASEIERLRLLIDCPSNLHS